MRRILVLILVFAAALMPSVLACEENEGGNTWETGDMLVVTGCEEWVSLRRTASTSAKRLAKIPLGKSVYFLSFADDGFCHVAYDGKYGYVLEKYLTFDGVSVRYVTGCEEWISLRESASVKAARLAKIPLGAKVEYTCTGRGEEFAWVNYSGKGGYALEKYLSLYPFESGQTLFVTNCDEYITLLREPSVNSKAVTLLLKNHHVNMVREAENGFVYIECDGLYGYVLPGYLTPNAPNFHMYLHK